MLDYKKQVHDYIIKNRDEIVEVLKELVKIPSVRGEAEENAPFGRACADVLEYTEKLYKNNGFETELDKDGGYLLSYYGNGAKSLGLFAHADVVPVADDWTFTKPFEPIDKDGFLFGRGVKDNKAGVVFGLYIAKMLKELDIPFKHRLVCFTGSNEESGMNDIQNYVKKHTPPDFSLVCDTGFPLYRGNKGMLKLNAVCNKPFKMIKNITGSNAIGAILGKATFNIEYNDEVYAFLKGLENERLNILKGDNEIIIETKGISKHTALPEGSLNAGYIACDALSQCTALYEGDRVQMEFLSKILSHYYGEAIGIDNDDAEFGKLTFTNDSMSVENGKLKLHFNLRFGAKVDIAQLKDKIQKEFSMQGWDIEFEGENAPYITDISHPLLHACLNAYKDFTGRYDAVPYINAGGTYGKYLPCAIETGLDVYKGAWRERTFTLPEGHGGVHQPDEFIDTEAMLDALELTMLMLLECDKEETK